MSDVEHPFPGMPPFIAEAATHRGFSSAALLGASLKLWHVSQIGNSLSSVAFSKTLEGRLGLLRHANLVREALAVVLEGMDRAILDVVTKHNLPVPEWLNNGSEHVGSPDSGNVRNDLGSTEVGGPKARPRHDHLSKPGTS